jgi:hypothetical protein
MDRAMQNILRKSYRDIDEPLNILTFLTHGRYETTLCKTNHNFYSIKIINGMSWDERSGEIPKNYHFLPIVDKVVCVPPHVPFDLILSQSPIHLDMARHLSRLFQLPLISLVHTMWMSKDYKEIQEKIKADLNVFISEEQRDSYGFDSSFGEINHLGIDTSLFIPNKTKKKNYAISVVNDWINRKECGFEIWKNISGYEGEPNDKFVVFGDTPGLSSVADSIGDLISGYQNASLYLNTTISSTMPMTILEAMACGCPVVTTSGGIVERLIVKHEHNGFIGKNIEELKRYTNILLEDSNLSKRMGINARNTIVENFDDNKFVKKWNDIFKKAANINLYIENE